MSNLNTSNVPALAFDFQNALQTFSTKLELKQRFKTTPKSESTKSDTRPETPVEKDVLFKEIKEMLADF